MVVCFLKFCHSYGRTGDEFMHRHGIPSIGKTGPRLCLSTCIYNLGCKFCDLTLIWETRRFAFHNWKARLFDVPTWLWTSQTLTVCFQTLKLMYLKHKQGKKCMHEGSLSIVVDSSPPNLLDTFRQLVACKARPAHGEKHESIYIYIMMMSKQVKQIPLDFRRAFPFLHLFLAVDHWDGSNVLLFFSETKIKYA